MRLPDSNELAAIHSDPEKGIRSVDCFYTDRDRRLPRVNGKMSVVRWVGRNEGTFLGYLDSSKDVRVFFVSMHKGA